MPLAIRRVAVLVLAALLGGAFAQDQAAPPIEAGDLLEVFHLGHVTPPENRAAAGALFGHYGAPMVANGVDAYLVSYATTDLDGTLTPITAQLFVPALEHGTQPVALYAFGSGTTGVGPACAPSREDAYAAQYGHRIGHYREYLQAYAGRGFVAIIPDYLGFNDPARPQAYFHAEAEARVLLDAIRATYAFLESHAPHLVPPQHVFTGGYSQGGHAAFAAADLRPTYAPEVPLHGMIGFAPTTDVERLLLEGPFYAPYIAVSYASAYPSLFDPAAFLADRWLPTLAQDTAVLCVDRAQQHYPFDAAAIYDPVFLASLRAGRLGETHPQIQLVLDENRTGRSGHGLPGLIVQGGQDIIVRDSTQESFVSDLCALGSAALYINYPDARHRHTRPAGFEDAVGWMRGIASGGAAPSSCALMQPN